MQKADFDPACLETSAAEYLVDLFHAFVDAGGCATLNAASAKYLGDRRTLGLIEAGKGSTSLRKWQEAVNRIRIVWPDSAGPFPSLRLVTSHVHKADKIHHRAKRRNDGGGAGARVPRRNGATGAAGISSRRNVRDNPAQRSAGRSGVQS